MAATSLLLLCDLSVDSLVSALPYAPAAHVHTRERGRAHTHTQVRARAETEQARACLRTCSPTRIRAEVRRNIRGGRARTRTLSLPKGAIEATGAKQSCLLTSPSSCSFAPACTGFGSRKHMLLQQTLTRPAHFCHEDTTFSKEEAG
eukprot:6203833-Pleurochrysis_carterae.AAC.1